MRYRGRWITGGVCLATCLPAFAAPAAGRPASTATPSAVLAPVAVEGRISEASVVWPDLSPAIADAAAALDEVPGGALVDNGGISGQTQFRGLTGYRNQVTIDGMGVATGGPNWMDPPLHYAPSALIASIAVKRGIPSVADSLDSLGTTVDAATRQSEYAHGDGYELHGWGEATTRRVDHGYTLAGQAGLSNYDNRLGLTAVTDQAGDRQTPYGRLRATSYDRKQYGIDFGHRGVLGETSGFVRRQRTGDTGTPSLPMDIDYFHTTLAELEQQARVGRTELTARFDYSHVEHRMANDLLRPAPDFSPLNGTLADPRYIRARSQRYGVHLAAAHPLAAGTFTAGFDGRWSQHDARVGNPAMPAFRVLAFDDIRRNTYSVFGQWAGPLGAVPETPWRGELGVRATRVATSAGAGGVSSVLPTPAQRLAAGFAAADRDQADTDIDIVARLTRDIGEHWQAELGLARKTRVPYYLERYGYIPLQATAGAADGNNTIGKPALDPETAYMIDLGLAFTGSRLSVSPAIYYHRIDDYITGIAYDDTPGTVDSDVERVSRVNGDDTPLRYANVRAELYGADVAARYRLAEAWSLTGGGGYTRGKRLDVDDDLYRIAPASLRFGVVYDHAAWRLSLAQRYVFAKDHIADSHRDGTTDRAETGGYGLTDIAARYRVTGAAWIELGVDNLFDKGYRDFMSGYNRVADSAVPVGARLPGAGRNAYATLHVDF